MTVLAPDAPKMVSRACFPLRIDLRQLRRRLLTAIHVQCSCLIIAPTCSSSTTTAGALAHQHHYFHDRKLPPPWLLGAPAYFCHDLSSASLTDCSSVGAAQWTARRERPVLRHHFSRGLMFATSNTNQSLVRTPISQVSRMVMP